MTPPLPPDRPVGPPVLALAPANATWGRTEPSPPGPRCSPLKLRSVVTHSYYKTGLNIALYPLYLGPPTCDAALTWGTAAPWASSDPEKLCAVCSTRPTRFQLLWPPWTAGLSS